MPDVKNADSQRVALFDNVKFIMITLMVVGHFADELIPESTLCKSVFLFIYAFHMPVLIFISGLFYSNRRNTSKVLFYLCGGFTLKICLSIVYLITGQGAKFSLLSDGGIPWFLFVLAAYQILMYVLRNTDKKFILVFSILLACFAGYDTSIGDYLYLSRLIIFFPFYLSGTMLTNNGVLSILNKHSKKLIIPALFIMALWFYLCFFRRNDVYIFRHLFTGRNPFSEDVISYGPAARLLCYVISFLTGGSLLVLIPDIRVPFFTKCGSRTLNVYFWHWIVFTLSETFFHIKDILSQSKSGIIAFLLLAVLLSIVLSGISIFDYPLKTIKKLCFKK